MSLKETAVVRSKAQGLEPLAMSFVLPHERKAMRLPVVPATYTALLETMSNVTIPVPNGSKRQAALLRDAAYPLWVDRSIQNGCDYLQSTGSAATWNIPNAAESTIPLPLWNVQRSYFNPAVLPATLIDSAAVPVGTLTDLTPLAQIGEYLAIYVPPRSQFGLRVVTGAAGAGSGLEAEVGYVEKGEVKISTVILSNTLTGYEFYGTSGAAIPAGSGVGNVPSGFVWLRSFRTRTVAPPAAANPFLQFGWASENKFETLGDNKIVLFLPLFPPAEFQNSTLPYSRTRLNASAALFTNVSAALTKEGTVLAARLKQADIDPWNQSETNLNQVHPKLRYYGPLEKGLYTFTTPSGNVDALDDLVYLIASDSPTNGGQKPLFQPMDVGVYNSAIFTDLGSQSPETQIAVSLYAHLEFETTSSLFNIGVSHLPLETLHAAEVALLNFGHFHENPLHWALIANAAKKILATVMPMVAPVVGHYGQMLVDKSVSYLRGKPAGDRNMTMASLQPPAPTRVRVKAKGKKKAKKSKKGQ
jgi:hypothetical protein